MPPQMNSNILYLGQIPFDWDQETVGSVVYGSGDIVDIRLGFDHVGKNKGFCFVEYRTVQDAAMAMPLLQQILIFTNNRTKKLRIESSKEGFKANRIPPESRPILQLNRSKLPPNVKLPDQMLINGTNNSSSQVTSQSMRGGNMSQYPPPPPTQQQQNQFQQPYQNYGSYQQTPPPPPPSLMLMPKQPVSLSMGPNQQMPQKLVNAAQSLPFNPEFRLETPDNINVTLSKIYPPELIQMIANMKNVAQTDPMRVQDFFHQNPQFTLPVAQALFLMGLIDNDVIAESQKSSSSTPQPQYTQTYYQNQGYQQNANTNPYGNNGQQFQQQQQAPPPPPPMVQNQTSSLTQNPRWHTLSPDMQRTILSFPPEQGQLALTIMTITPEEELELAPAVRQQYQNLRRQLNV